MASYKSVRRFAFTSGDKIETDEYNTPDFAPSDILHSYETSDAFGVHTLVVWAWARDKA